VTAPFDLRADSQTTDHPLFWPCPIPSTQVILLSAVSGIKHHRPHPPKALLLCTLFGAPSLAKAPAKLSWTMIWTLLLISSPVRRLRRHLSCAPSSMRSCVTLSHVLMATAMSELILSADCQQQYRSADWGGPSNQSRHQQPCPVQPDLGTAGRKQVRGGGG
jgi:hypothetical protein